MNWEGISVDVQLETKNALGVLPRRTSCVEKEGGNKDGVSQRLVSKESYYCP